MGMLSPGRAPRISLAQVRARVALVHEEARGKFYASAFKHESALHAEVLEALSDPRVAVNVRTVTTLAREALKSRDAFLL